METGQLANLSLGQARLLSFLKDRAASRLSVGGLPQELLLNRLHGFGVGFAFGVVRHRRSLWDRSISIPLKGGNWFEIEREIGG